MHKLLFATLVALILVPGTGSLNACATSTTQAKHSSLSSPGYKSPSAWHSENSRKQAWWHHEFMRRQDLLRIKNWEHHQGLIASQKAMHNPRSPQALMYRNVVAGNNAYFKTHPHKNVPIDQSNNKAHLN